MATTSVKTEMVDSFVLEEVSSHEAQEKIANSIDHLSKYGRQKLRESGDVESFTYKNQKLDQLRVRDGGFWYRLFFVWVKKAKCFFFIHAFKKKSNKTPKKDLDTAHKRAKRIINCYN